MARDVHPVGWFVASALVVVVVSAVGGWFLAVQFAHKEAEDDAAHAASRMARIVVLPHLYVDPSHPGHREGLRAIDEMVRARVAQGLVLRVKVWGADGTVLYSDEPRLIGRRFQLDQRHLDLIEEGGAYAELTQLEDDENVLDRRLGRGLDAVTEAYAASRSADGAPVLFEAYLSAEDLLHHEREVALWLVPTMTGGPVVLGALMLGLALRMSRRVRAAERESVRALNRVFTAASWERRQLARELHDSVIPELAAVRLSLEAAQRQETDPDRRRFAASMAAALARQQELLRAVLAGQPALSPARVGLGAALDALADQARAEGIDVTCEVTAPPLDDGAARLALAVAGEGLRNVRKHAGAGHATVEVEADEEALRVSVTDDGRGVSHPALHSDHGLGLIADTVSDLGGETRLEPRPDGGTTLAVRVPRQYSSDA